MGREVKIISTNNGNSERREIFTSVARVPHLQEYLQRPKDLIMSSLVLSQVPGELRCDRRGHQLNRLSPLSKADCHSGGGSPDSAQQLSANKRTGSLVRKIKQGVYTTLYKLRGRGSSDVSMLGLRRVSVLELRFGSPTDTSNQGPSYPVA